MANPACPLSPSLAKDTWTNNKLCQNCTFS